MLRGKSLKQGERQSGQQQQFAAVWVSRHLTRGPTVLMVYIYYVRYDLPN